MASPAELLRPGTASPSFLTESLLKSVNLGKFCSQSRLFLHVLKENWSKTRFFDHSVPTGLWVNEDQTPIWMKVHRLEQFLEPEHQEKRKRTKKKHKRRLFTPDPRQARFNVIKWRKCGWAKVPSLKSSGGSTLERLTLTYWWRTSPAVPAKPQLRNSCSL